KTRELNYRNLILMGDLYLDSFNFGVSILSSTVSDSDFSNIYPSLISDETYNRLSEISKSEYEYFIGYKWSSIRFQFSELHKVFALDQARSMTRNYKLSTSLNTQLILSIFTDGISSHGLSFSYHWF
ncbi:MAG TPA: hypothetical protein PLJ21_11570, partial [Pseudobdellovibrionaceae bacterium]|nr:hypothetical protein [Pseudobdellovibrionaceae bacterium]